MTARQIASHRYTVASQNSPKLAHTELVAEYRNLLTDRASRTTYARYVKLLPQLLDCQSALLLYALDSSGREITSHVKEEGAEKLVLGHQFCCTYGSQKVRTYEGFEKTEELVEPCKSFAAIAIDVSGLRLALLVATDSKPRRWSKHDLERLEDVSHMLVADLEITRERHLMTVQKRMQRSLVSSTTVLPSIGN